MDDLITWKLREKNRSTFQFESNFTLTIEFTLFSVKMYSQSFHKRREDKVDYDDG